jgi:hypothetical protein
MIIDKHFLIVWKTGKNLYTISFFITAW